MRSLENETGKVDILVGLAHANEDLYQELGGFDENCFMYSDDVDLSYRMLLKGKSNYYYPETTVIHYKGESTVKDGIHETVSGIYAVFLLQGFSILSVL
jgi:GT2 family glycosyltransferase